MPGPDEALLDDPVEAALSGPHARFALEQGRVRRYQEDVAPFMSMPSSPSAEDWQDAAALMAPGSFAAIRHTGLELPDGWQTVQEFELVQMVGEDLSGSDYPEAIALDVADVPEMTDLVLRTEPGPFLPRTVELGDYLGIRRDGALVAMAGERMRLEGWTEISAVCTDPEYRGQGLASRLMGALIAAIQQRSEGVFLHALATNTGAIRLYEELGFRVRQRATLDVVIRTPAEGAQA